MGPTLGVPLTNYKHSSFSAWIPVQRTIFLSIFYTYITSNYYFSLLALIISSNVLTRACFNILSFILYPLSLILKIHKLIIISPVLFLLESFLSSKAANFWLFRYLTLQVLSATQLLANTRSPTRMSGPIRMEIFWALD
jgi:hypothetical protein